MEAPVWSALYTGGMTYVVRPAAATTRLTLKTVIPMQPASQQFEPPQASKTGSFLIEATISTPVPIASASKTKINAVIFTIPPDNDHQHKRSARSSETASFRLFRVLWVSLIADLPDVVLASNHAAMSKPSPSR
jgi:hypothetical protein